MQRSVGIIPIVCLHIQCSSNHRHDVSSFRYTFAVILSTASWWWCRYSCFGARAGSGGRADEVEDVDLELGVALGLGGCFGAGFAFAFAFAVASVSWIKSGGTGVSAIAITWASVIWSPHLGRWSSRCFELLYSLIASKNFMISGRGSFFPFCKLKCITAIRRTCGRHAQMMSTASSVIACSGI